MKKITFFPCLLALLAVVTSCSQNKGFDHYWVISSKLDVLKSATKEPEVLGTLKFGDEVLGREPNLGSWVPKQWLEIKFSDGRGYVNKTSLGDKATIDEMNRLIASVKESQVQAVGETHKRTPFRLQPSLSSKLIELISKPTKLEVFERAVVEKESKGTAKKDVWYKVRLEDGRTGYVPSGFRLATPRELDQYTVIRIPIAWRELDEKVDPATGAKGKEYVFAYVAEGTPVDVDYSRIEVYSYEPGSGQYGTSLAKGGLSGKLPLTVKDGEEGTKIIEVRLQEKGKPEKLLVQEYSFPSPVKMIREYEIDN